MLCAQGVWTAHNRLALLAAPELVRSQIASFAKKVFRADSQPARSVFRPMSATDGERERQAAVRPRATLVVDPLQVPRTRESG